MCMIEEKANCIVNGSCPGVYNGVMEPQLEEYDVRRLTPTECARLQGFPDWWCDDLGEKDPPEEELAFWRKVWDTDSEINGKKKKTDSQILKWLKDPYSEAEEYKMWGNGVALPCVEFVLAGIKAWDEGRIEEKEDLPLLAWFNELEE